MFIDFSSRPPTAEFDTSGVAALGDYRRVYGASEERVSRESDGKVGVADYLAMYDALGARTVVLKARDSVSTFGALIRNEDVSEFCSAHGPRYIGFAGVDPHKGASAIEQFEHAIRGLGLRGLNIQCFEHRLTAHDRLLYPLYEKCVELGVPVNVHVGTNFSADAAMEHGQPIHLDTVLRDFPDLKMCASPPGWPWVQELVAVAWRHENLHIGLVAVRPRYLTKAGAGYEALLAFGGSLLQDRIIFGSSWPMQSVGSAVEEVSALPLSEPVKAKWLHDNAAVFLGLD